MFRLWLGLAAAMGLALSTAFAQDSGKKAAEPAKPAAPLDAANTLEYMTPGATPSPRGRSALFGSSANQASSASASPPEAMTALKSGTVEHARVVFRLKNLPAAQVNNILTKLFLAEGQLRPSGEATAKEPPRNIIIVPDPVTNCLIVSGTPDAVEEVQKLVAQLDRRPGQVMLEMEIGEVPAGATKEAEAGAKPGAAPSAEGGRFGLIEKPAHMENIGRLRLTTLDNQPAFAELGGRIPRVTATTVTSTGQASNVTLTDVGLIFKVTPRISLDGGMVTMLVNAVNSQLGPESEGTPIFTGKDGEVVRTPTINNTEVYTTVQVPDGQTVVLGSLGRFGKSGKELVIIVTPHILRPEETKAKP